jgi:hypothetical protein
MQNILKTSLMVSLCTFFYIYWPSLSIADGWHNPILRNKGFKEWAKDVKELLPQNDGKEINNKREKRDSKIELIPQVDSKNLEKNKEILKRKGWDAVKVLAHMEPENIIPSEFPNFDMSGIPQCRRDCKMFLMETGYIGAAVVVNQLVNALTGVGGFETGIILSPSYEQDMVDVLRSHFAAGRINSDQIKDLLNACKGSKPDERTKQLARMVRENVDISQLDILTIGSMANNAQERKWKNQLFREFKRQLESAALSDQIKILKLPILTNPLKKLVADSVFNNFNNLSPMDKLTLLSTDTILSSQRRKLISNLNKPSRLKKNQLESLEEILTLLKAEKSDVREAAKIQAQFLYVQAPITTCILHSALPDPQSRELLTKVIDKKIARASKERKNKYKTQAKEILIDPSRRKEQKEQAIYVLEKMNAAVVLAKSLVDVETNIQVNCGIALKRITGQSFGPASPVGKFKLSAIQKAWLEWLENDPRFD